MPRGRSSCAAPLRRLLGLVLQPARPGGTIIIHGSLFPARLVHVDADGTEWTLGLVDNWLHLSGPHLLQYSVLGATEWRADGYFDGWDPAVLWRDLRSDCDGRSRFRIVGPGTLEVIAFVKCGGGMRRFHLHIDTPVPASAVSLAKI